MTCEETEYERRVRAEIDDWENRPPGALAKALVKVTKPVAKLAASTASKLPADVIETIQKAVLGVLEGANDLARMTYSDQKILEEAQALGIEVGSIAELAEVDLEKLDRLSAQQIMSNKLMAAVEGAITGAGGFAGIAVDIPVVIGVSLRVTQQIGESYGFDMSEPMMRHVALRALSLGTAGTAGSKAIALTEMEVLGTMLRAGWTYERMAAHSQLGAAIKALKAATKHLPREISKQVTKRVLVKAVPVLSVGVGAAFNYWLISSTAFSARMLFRKLYLERKYPTHLADIIDIPPEPDEVAPPAESAPASDGTAAPASDDVRSGDDSEVA